MSKTTLCGCNENIYYDRCMDFLARMIEKYGTEISPHDGAVCCASTQAGDKAESLSSQLTYLSLTLCRAA